MKHITDHNREELISAYANAIVDGVDMSALIDIAVDGITKNLKDYTNEQLEDEIKQCYDFLLEDEDD
jgi:hypothetical protein